jgi:putative endonuclease
VGAPSFFAFFWGERHYTTPSASGQVVHLLERVVLPSPDISGTRVATGGTVQSAYRQKLGKQAEDLASRELGARGYQILQRRFRTQYGEIDIVARDGGTLVFVEVRARAGADYGSAEESITPRKVWRMTRMAQEYLMVHRLGDADCRFDVVAVDWSSPEPLVTVYQSAFDAVD